MPLEHPPQSPDQSFEFFILPRGEIKTQECRSDLFVFVNLSQAEMGFGLRNKAKEFLPLIAVFLFLLKTI